MMDGVDFKEDIFRQIEERNKIYSKFSELIYSHAKLYENNRELQVSIEKYKEEVESLKQEKHDLAAKVHSGVSTVERNENTTSLEKKVYKLQEELTEVHRTKGARAQQIIDLNVALQEKEREVSTANELLKVKEAYVKRAREKVDDLEQKTTDMQQANQTLKDEYQALLITYESIDNKLRTCQLENRELIDRWMRFKDTQADAINADNDKVLKKISEKTAANATKESPQAKEERLRKERSSSRSPTTAPSVSPPATTSSSFKERLNSFFGVKKSSPDEEVRTSTHNVVQCSAIVRLPQEAVCKWKAHDSEVTAARFSFSGGLLATGGNDKFVHVWNFFGDKSRLQYTLRGCNGGVTSIDFDPNEHVLAASATDSAAILWNMETQRMRVRLTGHKSKVLVNRFLGSSQKLASGSADRTVKVWDVGSGACTRTFMAGSSCSDIVSADAMECLASAHFDKKIRIWDARSSSHAQNEIVVGGRVTSLDMPIDKALLICCTKDHALELIDLRKSAVLSVFSHDQFKVATDTTRCCFSPDGQFVCAGSTDGSVLAWNVRTKQLESIVKEHNDPVISCNWSGGRLVTGDKNKTCVLWTES